MFVTITFSHAKNPDSKHQHNYSCVLFTLHIVLTVPLLLLKIFFPHFYSQ